MRYLILSVLLAGQVFAQRQIDIDPFSWLTKDQRIVALTLMGEARGEKPLGQYAVACVIRQRMKERKLSAAQVCLQSRLVKGKRLYQFSCWNGKTVEDLNSLLKFKSTYAIKLSINLCENKDFERRVTGFANHYCTLKTNPYWAKGLEPTVTIGNHKFFKLRLNKMVD